jgi:hypothetical protein
MRELSASRSRASTGKDIASRRYRYPLRVPNKHDESACVPDRSPTRRIKLARRRLADSARNQEAELSAARPRADTSP